MKMTDRDKMLLILLGVILVIALAAIVPTYGVMDCINSKKANEASIAELDIQLDEQLAEIRTQFGISDSAVAEDVSRAKKSIEKQIELLTDEAQRLAENTLDSSKNYRINTYWLGGLEYLDGEQSSGSETDEGEFNDERIVNVAFTDGSTSENGGAEKEVFEIGSKTVELEFYGRTIDTQVATNGYCVYFPNEEAEENSAIFPPYRDDAKNFGSFLLYIEHLSAKGAILIDEIQYAPSLQLPDSTGTENTEAGSESMNPSDGYKIFIRVLMTSGQNEVPAENPEEEEEE